MKSLGSLKSKLFKHILNLTVNQPHLDRISQREIFAFIPVLRRTNKKISWNSSEADSAIFPL